MRLKELREDSDIKQSTLAKYLHINQNTYSQYENEKRQLPISALISLAGFYKVSTDYILGLTSTKTPYPKNERQGLSRRGGEKNPQLSTRTGVNGRVK